MQKKQRWQVIYRRFFERYKHSGLSVNEFCTKERISPKSFYYRRKRLRDLERSIPAATDVKSSSSDSLSLIPLTVTRPPAIIDQPFEIHFPNAVRLFVPARFDPKEAGALIALCAGDK